MLMPKPLSLLHSRFRSVGSNPNRFVFDRSLWGDYGKWMPVLLGQNLLSVHGDSYLRDTLIWSACDTAKVLRMLSSFPESWSS